jgi:hypothetical protein
VTYTAVYASSDDLVTITLDQTAGVGATLSYTINGTSFVYVAGLPFTVIKGDTLNISASVPGTHEFVRWQDPLAVLGTSPSVSSVPLSGYDAMVTFTAVFATLGNRIEVTLASDPAGAPLEYQIGALAAVNYTASFPMVRSEILKVIAPAHYSSRDFARWDGPAGTIGTSTTVSGISLPATGTAVTYTAYYQLPDIEIHIDITGTGTVTVTGTGYSKVVTATGTIAVPESAGSLTFTASATAPWVFSHWIILPYAFTDPTTGPHSIPSGTTVYVTFLSTSDPENSKYIAVSAEPPVGGTVAWSFNDRGILIYRETVGGFSDGRAPASAEVTFTVKAVNPLYAFLYWSGDVSAMASGSDEKISTSAEGDIIVKAVFALLTDVVEVKIQINGSGSVLVSINNGPSFVYSEMFRVSVTDVVTTTAKPSTGWSFSHWAVDGTEHSAYERDFSFPQHTTIYATFVSDSKGFFDLEAWQWWLLLLIVILIIETTAVICYRRSRFWREGEEEETEH